MGREEWLPEKVTSPKRQAPSCKRQAASS